MSNTSIGIAVGSGVVGLAVAYAVHKRRNRSLLARTRKQAENFKDRAAKLSDSAAGLIEKGRGEILRQTKGVIQAIDAGRAAYQRVAG